MKRLILRKYTWIFYIVIAISAIVLINNFSKLYESTVEYIQEDEEYNEYVYEYGEPDFYSKEMIFGVLLEMFDSDGNEEEMNSIRIPLVILFVTLFARIILGIVYKPNLSKIDLKKYEGYYREFLTEYSIAELSYIDEMELDERTAVIATLLSLKNKNYISLENGEIQILKSDCKDLKESEKQIMNSISDGKVSLSRINMQTIAKEESKKDKLIIEKSDFRKNIIRFCLICFLIQFFMPNLFMVFFVTFFSVLDSTAAIIFIIAFSFILVYVLPILRIITMIRLVRRAKNNIVRTEKGEKINENIEGLKNYIRDFSTLDDENKDAVVLWNEYLVYSVAFGINTKIINEMSIYLRG